ncbi:glyceraldehyde-3-phosphate dehydrogenase [Congregibacter brevis]|uniref:Glyceraldehyde-3-phosphate dehydrogenase n=1 Tax=Congregibacter brevis TaxID=3081201 RepID=A0ABZ0IFH3_9GAMM|nr:glyceraldehyde-3-phosphate dehydrogenase [Congregibacter sp. IMCC45268]
MRCIAGILISVSLTAYGQPGIFTDPVDGRFDASRYLSENAFGFLPVPIIITEPAVDGGLGAVGLFFHESDEGKEQRLERLKKDEGGSAQLLTPSISAVAGAYTGNGSWFAGGGHVGFWKQGRVRYQGGAGVGNVNLAFYGSGDAELTSPIELNTEALGVLQSLKVKVADTPLFIGVSQRYIDATISPRRAGDAVGDLIPAESFDTWGDELRDITDVEVTTSGLGLTAEFDTRNNFFSPHKGVRYELQHIWFSSALGSDIDYELTSLTGLNYLPINDNWRAGLRLNAEYADADGLLPQYATPTVVLRGIPAARYQGNAVAVIEGEITRQIDPRWSINIFAGVGRADGAFSDLSDSASRVTRGAGFRYLVARRYGFEMGLDVAKGPEDSILYIQAGTAW